MSSHLTINGAGSFAAAQANLYSQQYGPGNSVGSLTQSIGANYCGVSPAGTGISNTAYARTLNSSQLLPRRGSYNSPISTLSSDSSTTDDTPSTAATNNSENAGNLLEGAPPVPEEVAGELENNDKGVIQHPEKVAEEANQEVTKKLNPQPLDPEQTYTANAPADTKDSIPQINQALSQVPGSLPA